MSGRTVVLILFFWAVLTIITPVLIRMSASAKPFSDSNGERKEEMKVRRVMKLVPKRALVAPKQRKTRTLPPAPAPAPALALEPDSGIKKLLQL